MLQQRAPGSSDIYVMKSADLSGTCTCSPCFTGLTLLQGGASAHVYIRITMIIGHANVPPGSKVSPI